MIDATINGDVKVVTKLSNNGIDMDAVIHEVCEPLCVYSYTCHDNKLSRYTLVCCAALENKMDTNL